MFKNHATPWKRSFNRRAWPSWAATLALLFALAMHGFAANLTVPNFGFETPALGNGQFQYGPSGATWALTGGGGLSGNGSGFTSENPNAPEGVQIAFIQGGGRVSQTIAGFSAGVTYTITFSAAQRNLGGSSGQTWNVQIDSAVVGTFAPPQSATSYTDYSTTFTTTTGSHEVAFQASNLNGGDNTVFIDNVRITYTATGTGTGLKGDYFTNTGLSGSPALSRTDATVNFDWNSASPDPVIPQGNYSVRWTGQVQPTVSETYTFYTSTDDGARLWVNGVQLVNQWTDHPEAEFSGSIALTANQKYDVVMEYYQGTGGAVARLRWSSASTAKAIIPQTQLYLPAATPAAPGALAATALSASSIRLTWTDNANNENGFAIERKTGAGGTYSQVASVGANVTGYTNTGLAAATQYYFRVRATNASGASAYAAEANAMTFPLPPNAPSGLAATAESTSSIRLNWTDNANNETQFKIERKTGAGGTYAQIATTGANVTTYTNTGLTPSTQYYYRVRANNTGGDSAFSSEANATTMGSTDVLNGIVGFWRFDENSGTTAADASGNNNTGTLNNGAGWISPGKVGAAALRLNDANLQSVSVASSASLNPTAGITIAAWIYATNWNSNRRVLQKGDGDNQYRLLAEWGDLKFHLTGVGTLTTALPAAGAWVHVAATWNGANMVIYFNGVQQTSAGAGGTLATTGDTLRIGTKNGSGGSGDYFLGLMDEVRIYNRGLSGSEVVTVMNAGAGGPSLPAAPSALAATTLATNQIRLTWTDNATNETGFKIERKTGAGGTYAQIATPGANVTSYTNTGLAANTQYYYRVRANNAAGDSAYASEANATTLPFPPAAPSGLVATPVSTSQINVSWTDHANNETGFEIERKTGAGGTYAFIGGTGVNVTSFADSGLSANTTYFYRVRAFNTGGYSAYSTETNATTSSDGTGTGLVGDYFNNVNLTGSPVLTRTDATVDFNWGTSAPHASVPADNYSVRWSGKVQPAFSETYTFYTYNDDGARLWVNSVQLVNDWTGHPATEFSGSITLTGGQQYDLVMEYYEGGGDAVARLSWSSASTPKAVIPQSRLYPPAPPTVPSAPSSLAATAVSASQINLTWTDHANNETQFKIERKTGTGGSYVQIATPGANSTTHSDTTVSASATYYYRIRANNSAGDSPFSNEANATTSSGGEFQNPGVYSQIVNGLRYEWIPTKDVTLEILADGKVKINAPLTKPSFNGANTCNRFIYDHAHVRLSAADSTALFGSGLALPTGNHGFTIQWYNASTYDEVFNNPWNLAGNPDSYAHNSAKMDYFNISIVPVTPPTPPSGPVQEILLPNDLQRVSWLPHYQRLPENLSLPADKGFGITRMLMDIPLEQVYQKVTQIQYVYGFLDPVPHNRKWKVLRAYPGESNQQLIQNAVVDVGYGYMSQMDEDFGNMGEPNHFQRAQDVLQGIYQRLVNERGVTSPNQTRMYDDYFSDLSGFGNSDPFHFQYSMTAALDRLSSQAQARRMGGWRSEECNYFVAGAYNYRNWTQAGYLDSFQRSPEGLRIYNEIYNYEKRFMAAPDRKVMKMGWANAEGVDSTTSRSGTESRLHFPTGDIIRSDVIAWPFHMMLNESFWALLLGHDFVLWHSSIPLVSDIQYWADSGAAGAGQTQWQPTGGSVTTYDPNNPSHPARATSSQGRFPENPQVGESGAFAGAWLVTQLTTASDRTSQTIEYCPFSYRLNGGPVQSGYYNGNQPANGSLGNAKLSRYGVANYGQANIVRSFEARRPLCIYTAGANGAAVIYQNLYSGLNEVNEVTITTPNGPRTFQVTGSSLHVFHLN